MDSAPDQAVLPLVGLAIARELTKRRKLPEHNTFDDAVSLLQQSKNIIVVSGAGVSGYSPSYASTSFHAVYPRLGERIGAYHSISFLADQEGRRLQTFP